MKTNRSGDDSEDKVGGSCALSSKVDTGRGKGPRMRRCSGISLVF